MSLFKRLFGKNKKQEDNEQEALKIEQNDNISVLHHEQQVDEVVSEEAESDRTEQEEHEAEKEEETHQSSANEEIVTHVKYEEKELTSEACEEEQDILKDELEVADFEEIHESEDLMDERTITPVLEADQVEYQMKRMYKKI